MRKLYCLSFIVVHCFSFSAYGQIPKEPFDYNVSDGEDLYEQSHGVWQKMQTNNPGGTLEKPNVIIVFSDDQGYGDFSAHGNPVLKTPALDKLRGEGVRFSNFHVSPLCTPSRGQLLSGLDAMNNKASTVLSGRGIMRRDVVTMPQILKDNGYKTGIFGKWHLGENYPDRPMDKGFDKCLWIKGWGLFSESEYDNDYYKTRYLDDLQVKYSDEYCTDLWFDKAIEWMEEMVIEKQPFFTYLALNAPHGPYYAKEEDYSFYRNFVNNSTASFLGMIAGIDQNMQYLDQWLEKRGLKNNTIVIFMNDNGGTGGVQLYNAGMRGEKGDNYDGGHRAACFLRWPNGNLGTARTINYPAQVQDILPTVLDLCKVPKDYEFDGESLLPILETPGSTFPSRMFVVQQGNPVKYNGCVVWDSWRLVGNNELYNLSADPAQSNNVISSYPEIATTMRDFYEAWWNRLSPDTSPLVHLQVGDEVENPTILSCGFWVGANVNTMNKVAAAEGGEKGGKWYIQVKESGKYKILLSRWPFHLNRLLTADGPSNTIGGMSLSTGVAMPIKFGCISVNESLPQIKQAESGDSFIEMEMDLNQGEQTLQAWFKDANNKDLCGAYYVSLEKL